MRAKLSIEKPWQRWAVRLGIFAAMLILIVPGAWVVLTAFRPNIEVLARPVVDPPTARFPRRPLCWSPACEAGAWAT